MNISKTDNYGRFHLLPMNREIMPRHADKMAKSIKSIGIIRPIVTCETNLIEGGKKKLYVLDGQHLLTGIQRLEMEVPYVKVDVTSEIDIVKKMGLMNSSSKSWNLLNYINAYRFYFPDYSTLFRLHNTYNMDLYMLAVLCSSDSRYDSGNGLLSIKNGDFKITNKDYEKTCKDLTELFDLIPSIEYHMKRRFLRAFMKVVDRYDHSKALTNVRKHSIAIQTMSSEDECVDFLSKNVFNF